MAERRARLSLPVNGQEIAVRAAAHLRCPRCHEVVLRAGDARWLRERAIEIFRAKYGLLSAQEIRSLRGRLGLTQRALARLLKVPSHTISRWESGRTVQSAAVDILLRLVRDLPGSLDYLRRHAA